MLIQVSLALNPTARKRLKDLLRSAPVMISELEDPDALRRHLSGGDLDLLISGPEFLGDHITDAVRSVRALPESPDVILLTDTENPHERAGLQAAGCLGVMSLELDDDELKGALLALIRRRRDDAITRLRADRPEERYSLGDFISESPRMQLFLDLARRVVHTETSLLILGETGVGKERLARAIHVEGPRSKMPFLAINCGALSESLLESELFGHEEGAFTGASRSRRGFFELAHRGTIFLDEIGEMPTHLQVKIFRVIDERSIRRVGGERSIPVDVRIMAATNRDLEQEMKVSRFRPDLFYRLAVVTLTIPPLRDRREDIANLAASYLEHFNVQTGQNIRSIGKDAMQTLLGYDWPGNVRELINAIERSVLLCQDGKQIAAGDLPQRIVASVRGEELSIPTDKAREPLPDELLNLPLAEARRRVVNSFEARYLLAILKASGGRINETAAQVGISERSLYDLMKRHGLRKETFKAAGKRGASRVNPA